MVSKTPQGDGLVRNVIYARWREDKPAEPGFSKELISVDTPKEFWDNHAGQPNYIKGCNTYLDYFERNVKLYKDDRFLGTRVKLADVDGKPTFGDYAWKTFGEIE